VVSFQNSSFSNPTSIVEAIINGSPNAHSRLLEQYGSRLLFLIRRHCYERAEQFSAAVFSEAMEAVLNREIATDSELPKLIRSIFRRLLPTYEEHLSARRAQVLDEIGRTHSGEVNQICEALGILRPMQLRALNRYYEHGESVSSICFNLGFSEAEFSDTIKVAWQIVLFALQDSQPRKRPFTVLKTTFNSRAVAGR